MKKIPVLLLVVLLLVGTLASCGAAQNTASQLTPKPAPTPEPYVPDPLNVEFFTTSYTNMSPWKKYPSDTEDTTAATTTEEAPATDDTPTEDASTATE